MHAPSSSSIMAQYNLNLTSCWSLYSLPSLESLPISWLGVYAHYLDSGSYLAEAPPKFETSLSNKTKF
jgi:hypothetical protein